MRAHTSVPHRFSQKPVVYWNGSVLEKSIIDNKISTKKSNKKLYKACFKWVYFISSVKLLFRQHKKYCLQQNESQIVDRNKVNLITTPNILRARQIDGAVSDIIFVVCWQGFWSTDIHNRMNLSLLMSSWIELEHKVLLS